MARADLFEAALEIMTTTMYQCHTCDHKAFYILTDNGCIRGPPQCTREEICWFRFGITVTKGRPYCGHCVRDRSSQDHIAKCNNKTTFRNWLPPCRVCIGAAYAMMLIGENWENVKDDVITVTDHVCKPKPPPPPPGAPPIKDVSWQPPFLTLTSAPPAPPLHRSSPAQEPQSDEENEGHAWAILHPGHTVPVPQGVVCSSPHVPTSLANDDGSEHNRLLLENQRLLEKVEILERTRDEGIQREKTLQLQTGANNSRLASLKENQQNIEELVKTIADGQREVQNRINSLLDQKTQMWDQMSKHFETSVAAQDELIRKVEEMDTRVGAMETKFASADHAGGSHDAAP